MARKYNRSESVNSKPIKTDENQVVQSARNQDDTYFSNENMYMYIRSIYDMIIREKLSGYEAISAIELLFNITNKEAEKAYAEWVLIDKNSFKINTKAGIDSSKADIFFNSQQIPHFRVGINADGKDGLWDDKNTCLYIILCKTYEEAIYYYDKIAKQKLFTIVSSSFRPNNELSENTNETEDNVVQSTFEKYKERIKAKTTPQQRQLRNITPELTASFKEFYDKMKARDKGKSFIVMVFARRHRVAVSDVEVLYGSVDKYSDDKLLNKSWIDPEWLNRLITKCCRSWGTSQGDEDEIIAECVQSILSMSNI